MWFGGLTYICTYARGACLVGYYTFYLWTNVHVQAQAVTGHHKNNDIGIDRVEVRRRLRCMRGFPTVKFRIPNTQLARKTLCP